MKIYYSVIILILSAYLSGIAQIPALPGDVPCTSITPRIITDTTKWDTDDPAIWINPGHPSKSLIIGTDKNRDGALYAFDLKGKVIQVVNGLEGPNNVDVAYGFPFNGETIDIAVVTERLKHRLRVLRLPEMELIDEGDLIVFDGDSARAPMGIALYKRPNAHAFYVFVSGKSGPEEGYIGQYQLKDGGDGKVEMEFVRQFGKFSGIREIESIAVDTELGYVYYSDEKAGVRKYHADPDATDAYKELAIFATEGFTRDHEGISIYKRGRKKGYILVSDQQANQFWIYSREGSRGNPHNHRLLKIIKVETIESDGSDVTCSSLPGFPFGLFVAMSNGKTFHFYDWRYIAGKNLKSKHSKNRNKSKQK